VQAVPCSWLAWSHASSNWPRSSASPVIERRCKLVDISDAIGGPTYEVRGHEQVRGEFIGGSFMLPVVARRVTSAAAGIEEIEMK
jgi:hypothetical protein